MRLTVKSLLLASVAFGGSAYVGAVAQTVAGDAITRAPAPNQEPETGPVNDSGFVLSIDGVAIDADPQVEDRIRRTDVALEQADLQVRFDGIDPTPRLNIEMGARQGGTVTLRSEMTYPAFVTRGEMRIYDRGAPGGARLIQVVPVAANGTVTVALPEGRDIVAVHRVYDSRGRFDQTAPLALNRADARGLSDQPDGADFTARRGIPVRGGAVTVSASHLAPGAQVATLGETVRADGAGRLVLERILPAGTHTVDVAVQGGPQLSRPIDIPRSQWFAVAVADLTYGAYRTAGSGWETRSTGRLAGFIDGETNGGTEITASIDTGDGDLRDIFRRLQDKDPRTALSRIDPADSYPTFGDDSTAKDLTPTSGRIYLRAQRGNSFALWGDSQARLSGHGFLRNERVLYGAQLHLESAETTTAGQPKRALDLYAAQPDHLVGREVFLGTGGSVYMLRRQDIAPGTAVLSVELRDAATRRVIERRDLVPGRDYEINDFQGVITLTAPLNGAGSSGLIQTNPGGDIDAALVVQYEYAPTTRDVDGFAFGGRSEAWVTDDLRVGVIGLRDETPGGDQTAVGADLRYTLGDNSFVQLDYARSEGPGYVTSISRDGGVISDSAAATAGQGAAIKIEAQLDLADVGAGAGIVGGYAERREEGFTSLDHQVRATTGDELLYGAYLSKGGLRASADRYEAETGETRTELALSHSGQASERLRYELGAEYLDQVKPAATGERLTLAARLTYAASDALSYGAYAQAAVIADGLPAYDRYGVFASHKLSSGWAVEAELSGGTGGIGGRVLARHARGNSSTYFGYDLDPGRAIDARIDPSDNGGKYVMGGRRQIGDSVSVTAENTYDAFGPTRSLTGSYGVEYAASDYLSYSAGFVMAKVTDEVNGDFDRRALSFGVKYDADDLTARARVELRQDKASAGSTRPDLRAVYVSSDLRYEIDESRRLMASFDGAYARSDESSLLNGKLVDVSLGYAYRPVDNDRLNLLARLRYLHDDFGQQLDGVAGAGPVQVSHVVSVEGSYDLTPRWTLGGKLAGRKTRSAPTKGGVLVDNDAWLTAVNARYHLVHKWDVLVEARQFTAPASHSSEAGVLAAAYRHVGEHTKIGIGYNFARFSDDLTDLTQDDEGLFLNVIAKF